YSGPDTIYSNLCLLSGTDEFVSKVGLFLNETDLTEVADEKYKLLEKKLPMKSSMEEVINTTWKHR
ncbi:hypothetical protein OAR29_05965, partial [Rhodospirillales bacterium]|nr:hypothetical protein [Rhodospirillales bacterium]